MLTESRMHFRSFYLSVSITSEVGEKEGRRDLVICCKDSLNAH
jgi:hypothetical protein